MATNKKKKRNRPAKDFRTNWIIPEPTPGDEVDPPDVLTKDHAVELLEPFAIEEFLKNPRRFKHLPPDNGGASVVERTLKGEFFDRINGLIMDYYDRLADMEGSLSEEELRAGNLIDISAIYGDARTIADFTKYSPEFQKYLSGEVRGKGLESAIAPCFREGTLCSSRDLYVRFRTLEIDPDTRTLSFWMESYQRTSPGKNYFRSTAGTARFVGPKKGTRKASYEYGNGAEGSVELLSRIPPSKLPWSRQDKILWEKVVIQDAVDQAARRAYRGKHEIVDTLKSLMAGAMISNYRMSKYYPENDVDAPESPQKGRRTEDISQHGGDGEAAPADVQGAATKIIHEIGGIRITSSESPKAWKGSAQPLYMGTAASVPKKTDGTSYPFRTVRNGKTTLKKGG